jgi:hypothetical protein
MSRDPGALLDRVGDLVAERMDAGRVHTARRRHADILAGRESDYIPMIFGRAVPEAKDLPNFNWAEQWHNPARSLYQQLKDNVLPLVAADSDAVPGVRADTGVINCMTIFGAEFVVPEHTKPVISKYVPKERLAGFEVPEDVSRLGIMPTVAAHMEHHKAALAERGLGNLVSVYHCDQQGPWDIAAQSRGHDIFIDLYEDPQFVHTLMRKAVRIYIAVTKLCKRTSGEPLDSGNTVGYWSETGGVRMCGDSDILVRREQFAEFIQPYEQEALAAFGGGWFHYCGGWPGTGRSEGLHLHDLYAEIKGLRGLNWTTARDWLAEMRRLVDLGLAHLGTLPRAEGESLEDYFRRALSPYARRGGMIFTHPELKDGEVECAMDLWHRVQDERLGT